MNARGETTEKIELAKHGWRVSSGARRIESTEISSLEGALFPESLQRLYVSVCVCVSMDTLERDLV